jgi:hypothetical protein
MGSTLPRFISQKTYEEAFDKYIAEGKTEKEADVLCGVPKWNYIIRMETAAKEIVRLSSNKNVHECFIILSEEEFTEECKKNRLHWETIRRARVGTSEIYPYYVKYARKIQKKREWVEQIILDEAEDYRLNKKERYSISGSGSIYESINDDDSCRIEVGYKKSRMVVS